jgi:signal transduction histidine kinase
MDKLKEPTSKDLSLCFYRVAQQALKNVLQHANSRVAVVTLSTVQERVYMSIRDIGILSMSERVELILGKFRIDSEVGRGTSVWVEVVDGAEMSSPKSG